MCPTTSSETIGAKRFENKPDLRAAFDVLDGDGDGRISYGDLRAFYGGVSEDVIDSMISAADSNKNGYVEYEEFEEVVKARRMQRAQNALMEDAFRLMDKDGDGKIGLEDLKIYLGWAGVKAHEQDVKAMIELACGDANEGVTLDSFLKILAVG